MKIRITLFLGCLFFMRNNFAQETPAFIKDSLETYVQYALKNWQIPGIAVCVVKDGKVVVMKGFGVKEMDATDKVDEDTLSPMNFIKSNCNI